MSKLRFITQQYRFIWLFFLALSLITVQYVNIHLDVYDHHHANSQSLQSHAEHGIAHVCGITCNNSHEHENISELDIRPAGLLKKFSYSSLLALLLITALIIFINQPYGFHLQRPREIFLSPRLYTGLLPPLRAPPR